jgi:hypothetical protein
MPRRSTNGSNNQAHIVRDKPYARWYKASSDGTYVGSKCPASWGLPDESTLISVSPHKKLNFPLASHLLILILRKKWFISNLVESSTSESLFRLKDEVSCI